MYYLTVSYSQAATELTQEPNLPSLPCFNTSIINSSFTNFPQNNGNAVTITTKREILKEKACRESRSCS